VAKTAQAGFDQFLTRLTPSSAERLAASSHRASIEAKLQDKFGLYRMFESGSFKHGTGVSSYSDVDYFVSLKSSRPQYSSSTLAAVRDALLERFPTTNIHVARPAVVLDFGSGSERVEVIAAYANEKVGDDRKFRIPGVNDEWIFSTPEAHLRYVTEANKRPVPGAVKQLSRLVKAWKYYRNVPISSFYLEMRAVAYMKGEKSVDYAQDIYYILRSLQSHSLADMNDPTGNTGRIQPCSSDANKRDALSKLDTAVSRASKAKEYYLAGNIADAFAQWDLLFNGHFPSYY
jgi:hypothetical protein